MHSIVLIIVVSTFIDDSFNVLSAKKKPLFLLDDSSEIHTYLSSIGLVNVTHFVKDLGG